MGNCLKTQLKGSLLNPDLPTFNELVLDTFSSVPGNPLLLLMTGSKPVTIDSKVKVYTSSSYASEINYTLSANTMNLLYMKKSDIDALADTKGLFKIKGEGVYTIKKIGNSFLSLNNTAYSGLDFLEYNDSLKCFGSTTTSDFPKLPTSVKLIMCSSCPAELVSTPYAIEVISSQSPLILGDVTLANSSIKNTGSISTSGDIKFLPKNLLITVCAAAAYGTIDDLVESMVERGRTSGSIKFSLYNSTRVKEHLDDSSNLWTKLGGTGSSALTKVLVWTGVDSYTWQDNDTPETASAPSTSMYDYPV